jgi:hypothetical protein
MFPLYDQIRKRVSNITVSDKEKEDFLEFVASSSEHEHELVYALIRFHHIYNDDNFHTPSYKSKIQKKGIKFDFDNFPCILQNVLVEFSKMNNNVYL